MEIPDFLTRWPNGEIVLTGHRIGLYSVIDLLQRGCTSDEFHDEFPSLPTDLIRKVIDFHRCHRADVDTYVNEYRADLECQELASRPGPTMLRIRRLMAEKDANRQPVEES